MLQIRDTGFTELRMPIDRKPLAAPLNIQSVASLFLHQNGTSGLHIETDVMYDTHVKS
jgi:hypothetical protein